MDNLSITYVRSSNVASQINVYEIERPDAPSIIYVQSSAIPDADRCKPVRQDIVLDDPVITVNASTSIDTYILRCNSADTFARIYAHYGLIRAGGLDFSIADMHASSDTSYVYELEFNVLDIPALFARYRETFANYTVLEQLSFDVAEYNDDNHRTSIDAIHLDTAYNKLTTKLSLNKNILQVTAVDLQGNCAGAYLASIMNVADIAMQCQCLVQLHAIDVVGNTTLDWSSIVANADYGDTTMLIPMPNVPHETAAVKISIRYTITLTNSTDIIVLQNALALTAEQIANLMLMYGASSEVDVTDLLAQIQQQQQVMLNYSRITY